MITKDLCILSGLSTKAADRSGIFGIFLGRGVQGKDGEMSPGLFSGTGELRIALLMFQTSVLSTGSGAPRRRRPRDCTLPALGEQSRAGLLKPSPGSKAQGFVHSTGSFASHQHCEGCFCLSSAPGVYGLSTTSAPVSKGGLHIQPCCTKISVYTKNLLSVYTKNSSRHFFMCFTVE